MKQGLAEVGESCPRAPPYSFFSHLPEVVKRLSMTLSRSTFTNRPPLNPRFPTFTDVRCECSTTGYRLRPLHQRYCRW